MATTNEPITVTAAEAAFLWEVSRAANSLRDEAVCLASTANRLLADLSEGSSRPRSIPPTSPRDLWAAEARLAVLHETAGSVLGEEALAILPLIIAAPGQVHSLYEVQR